MRVNVSFHAFFSFFLFFLFASKLAATLLELRSLILAYKRLYELSLS